MAAMNSAESTVKVWDPLVRLFHWSLVVSFAVAYLSGEGEEQTIALHVYSGYIIGGLVLFRLLWGVIGSRHARFADFIVPPHALLDYAIATLRGQARRTLGHNPFGGAMVIALLVMLTLATLSGLALYGEHDQAGPLAGLMRGTGERAGEWLEETHELFSNLTLALVGLHIAGVLWTSRLHHENLVRAMITGRKRA